MKRILAVIIAVALLAAIPIMSAAAAGSAEKGELLITQDPEKIEGAVGEIVKVNFYLYPNLPDGRKLDSLSGSMKYDQTFVTLGAINQVDEENNLTSWMKSKGPVFQPNIDQENGIFKFAFIDIYGVENDGFWFQAEFRIEKEGATDFIFNGITYTGIDSNYKAITFVIDPVSIGGIYTAGETPPENGAVQETFAPLTPAVETPAPVTPTPRPSNGGQTVPVTSTLPTYSAVPTINGVVTPQPAVTSMPMVTAAPQQSGAPTQQDETPAPQQTDPLTPVDETTPEPGAPDSDDPNQVAEVTPFPIGSDTDPNATPAPEAQTDPSNHSTSAPSGDSRETTEDSQQNDDSDQWLIIGIIGGMVAVVGLGILAIVLLIKRRKMSE